MKLEDDMTDKESLTDGLSCAWVLKRLAQFILGCAFWVCLGRVHASGPHAPFDFFDGETLWGLAAWMCAWLCASIPFPARAA